MDYRNAKQEMALLQNRVAADEARSAAIGDTVSRVARKVGAVFSTLLELPRRRSVQNELRMLSDRELNDIGLTRAEVSHIYDADFLCASAGRSRRAGRVCGPGFGVRRKARALHHEPLGTRLGQLPKNHLLE